MNSLAFIWSDPRFVYAIAFVAILLLFVTVWLFRRPKRAGRQAGIICLMLSIFAHLALLLLVPMLSKPDGGSATIDPCLLYTSPSPRDRTRSRMPSSA